MYRSRPYLLIFILKFQLTAKIYSSMFLLRFMSTVVPIHQYTCSIYFFFFGITCTVTFQFIYWGSYTEIYPEINLPVYLPASLLSNHKDLPVTTITCVHTHRSTHSLSYLFNLFHSNKLFVLTCPLTHCSKYSQIYPFIKQPVPSVCVFLLALHAHLSVNSSASLIPTDPPENECTC